MAEEEDTSEGPSDNLFDRANAAFERLRQDVRQRHRSEIERRNAAAVQVSSRVLAVIAAKAPREKQRVYTREKEHHELAAAALAGSREPIVLDRAPRPRSWQGPHHGKRFTDVASLQAATIEECHAGHIETWGYRLTDRDLEVYRTVQESPNASADAERRARDIYTDLRKSIEAAHRFAVTYYNNAAGAGMRALDALWEHLPPLPKVETLPGYVKRRSPHARFVLVWQEMARENLGWKLERRELAEVSILLGISAIPYKDIIATSGKMFRKKAYATVSDVIEWESKNLDRALGSRRKQGPAGVEGSK